MDTSRFGASRSNGVRSRYEEGWISVVLYFLEGNMGHTSGEHQLQDTTSIP